MQWVEAARIGRRPNGEVFCADIFMQYSKPTPVAAAIEKALAGKTVFVRREDAATVLAALHEQKAKGCLTGEIHQSSAVQAALEGAHGDGNT